MCTGDEEDIRKSGKNCPLMDVVQLEQALEGIITGAKLIITYLCFTPKTENIIKKCYTHLTQIQVNMTSNATITDQPMAPRGRDIRTLANTNSNIN